MNKYSFNIAVIVFAVSFLIYLLINFVHFLLGKIKKQNNEKIDRDDFLSV